MFLRRIFNFLGGKLPLHSKLVLKARHPGEKRPFTEVTAGEDLRRQTGTWVKKERVINRDHDWYSETVTDPETGEVIHSCRHPLSEHRGHGSAKGE